MPSDNSVTLVGNVTRDPELRFTNTGQANVTFGLAVNRRWQNRQTQEWEEATSFFDVVCWREMAENVSESITRGSRIRWPDAWSSAAGRPRRATSAPRSRWWRTRSARHCAGPPHRSPRTSVAAPGKYSRGGGGGGGGGGGRPAAAPPAQPQPAADAGPGYGFDEEPF